MFGIFEAGVLENPFKFERGHGPPVRHRANRPRVPVAPTCSPVTAFAGRHRPPWSPPASTPPRGTRAERYFALSRRPPRSFPRSAELPSVFAARTPHRRQRASGHVRRPFVLIKRRDGPTHLSDQRGERIDRRSEVTPPCSFFKLPPPSPATNRRHLHLPKLRTDPVLLSDRTVGRLDLLSEPSPPASFFEPPPPWTTIYGEPPSFPTPQTGSVRRRQALASSSPHLTAGKPGPFGPPPAPPQLRPRPSAPLLWLGR
jgi:hypothetical protein